MTPHLCQQCSKIPFDQELKTLCSAGYDGPLSWSLGTFGKLRLRACSFCQLVAPMCSKSRMLWHPLMPPDDSEEVIVEWCTDTGVFNSNQFRISSGTDRPCICLAETSEETLPYRARETFDEFIDFNDVGRWISNCDRMHAGSESRCLPTPFNPAILPRISKRQLELRLIDVKEMCIVYAQPKCIYVALSYVWGSRKNSSLILTNHNEDALMQPGALADKQAFIANTIWDSMTVVRKLGERYLWVDSLCLVQDDAVELQECVAIMDLFYEMASLTIVAGDGEDAWAGLQGVEPTSRMMNRPVKEIIPGLKLTKTSEMESLLRKSVYSTRAWTMQEEVLSSRRLAFINGQIYFHCNESYISEALNWPGKPLQNPYYSIVSIYHIILAKPTASFSSFMLLLTYYMLRKFSVLSGLQCFEGLPPPLERSLLFQMARELLKGGVGNPGRRYGFPSYSWTGWKSPSEYHGHIDDGEVCMDRNEEQKSQLQSQRSLRRWIIWHCKLENGNLFRITDTGRCRKSLLPKPGDAIQNSRSSFQRFPIMVSDVDYSKVPSLSYPLLLFWTLCMDLRLWRAPPEVGELAGIVTYFAMDKFGKCCGKVEMDMAVPDIQSGQFALLASTDDALWALILV